MDSLIPKNKDIEIGISNITQQALCLKVVDNKTYAQAGSMRNMHTEMKKTIKAWFKEHIEKAHESKEKAIESWRSLRKAETDEMDKMSPAVQHLDKEMLAWEKEEEKIRLAEEERLREIARKEAEDQQMKDALEAEKEGNKEEAEAILNEEPHVPTPIVEKTTPKIAGLGTVTNWKFRIVDESKIPHRFMTPDLVKIGGIVRAMKSKCNIEGVEAYPKTEKRGTRQ